MTMPQQPEYNSASEAVVEDTSSMKSDHTRSPEWSLCSQVPHLPNGEKAALRRIYLTNSYRADGIVQKLVIHSKANGEADLDDDAFESWKLLAHAAAVISGTSKRFPHADKRSLGRSMSLIGVSENALLRLVSARGPALADQVRRLVRLLARGGTESIPTNLATLRQLADPEPNTAERARRQIARDYFAAADAASSKAKGDTK